MSDCIIMHLSCIDVLSFGMNLMITVYLMKIVPAVRHSVIIQLNIYRVVCNRKPLD